MHLRPLACAPFLVASWIACASEPPPQAPSADPATLRHLPAGDVVGSHGRHGGHAWLGLPYAEPPQGELRWRAPQPLLPWTATREALTFGASCPQLASRVGGDDSAEPGALVGDEDCLTLNVYAPAFAPDQVPTGAARLPVMVWIHGGGNTIGAANGYDGSRLATTHPLIVVMVNYRLGALGWFRHAALRAGRDPVEASGNFGTLDQLRALAWVRDNAAAFGGDPGNVTIFGESAGGQNVLALLVSPLAGGLFQRAIVQSGGTGASRRPRRSTRSTTPSPARRRARRRCCSPCSSAKASPATAPPPARRSPRCRRPRWRPSCAACPSRACSRRTPRAARTVTTRRVCFATAPCCRPGPSRRPSGARARTTRCR